MTNYFDNYHYLNSVPENSGKNNKPNLIIYVLLVVTFVSGAITGSCFQKRKMNIRKKQKEE